MGSLTSGPDIQSPQPQVVFVPQAVNNTPQTTSVDTTSVADTATEDAETVSQARRQSLIDRERSRFGTVQTSFRGLLGLGNSNAENQSRKTLLGE